MTSVAPLVILFPWKRQTLQNPPLRRQSFVVEGSGSVRKFRWGERLSRRSLAKADPREPARQ